MSSSPDDLIKAQECVAQARTCIFLSKALLADVDRSEAVVDLVLVTSYQTIQASRELLRRLNVRPVPNEVTARDVHSPRRRLGPHKLTA
jgi:hypothetical protein